MFKALELTGFKSFADRTRFEFPPGVTVIVGPNGSGKSNIVDSVKWVLGAQSVKSLRGKEMADVIFNGSGARRAINTAEVTLTLDNQDGIIAVDTPEVQVTRRVYRSGEGEYLINRQPCRLRDIKELFAGTGIATEAYSIIEQGKVDVMLQSSPRDRRIIFEEAAGISRFKAKKLEAERRLVRVDQNMLRLSDIVDEVDSRLRTVRSQATRAQRYREYTERLKELRTQIAVSDWRRFSRSLEALHGEIGEWTDERDRIATSLEVGEARSLELDADVFGLEEQIRSGEGRLLETQRRITEIEATREHQSVRNDELCEGIGRLRRQLAAMSVRAGGDLQKTRNALAALVETEQEARRHAEELRREEESLQKASARLGQIQSATDQRRSEHMEAMRAAASLGSQISVLRSQFSSAGAAETRCIEQLAALKNENDLLTSALGISEKRLFDLTIEADECGDSLHALRRELTDVRRRLTVEHKEVAVLVGSRAGAIQRADVLKELERRLEGVGAGVRDVLERAKRDPEGPFRGVRGLVADLLHVSVDMAPVVEVAIAEKADFVVLSPSGVVLETLASSESMLAGRIHFLRLDVQPAAAAVDRIDLKGQTGVIDRLDRMVDAKPEFIPLIRRLLGRTWLVEDWETAVRLSVGAGRGLDFVTKEGQRIGADGTLVAGPKEGATGLISRRSELSALFQEIERLDEQIADREERATELEKRLGELDQKLETLAPKHGQLTGALSEQRLKTVSLRDQLEQVVRQLEALETERLAANSQAASAKAEPPVSEHELHSVDQRLAELESKLEEDTGTVAELRETTEKHQRATTERRVAFATSQQRLDTLRSHIDQWKRDQSERGAALDEARLRLRERKEQKREVQAELLHGTRRLAELYLEAERHSSSIAAQTAARQTTRNQRNRQTSELQTAREELRRWERKLQEKQLAAASVAQQRETLVDRMHDEYGIDLTDAGGDTRIAAIEIESDVEQEIDDLRRKINNVGAVNLTALEELEELETRSNILTTQFEDLSQAKASLEQIIGRINVDSRRMFSETIETVRAHFTELFRKLFGGGQADIVLDGENGEDVLNCGIEIIARPPGKDPRSISLLSGGEKTLTCVALLLAIFRSRPSPFCVLDEVDAALDEANIERFTSVLREFLTSTQFIVITHSKKTMTHANTLYGVTMQESGISKQVSVRFEDVSDDGTIRPSAVDRTKTESRAPDDDETQAA